MTDAHRSSARQLCRDAIARSEPLAWFEELYATGADGSTTIPWADLKPNPNLVDWVDTSNFNFHGLHCLKVGCGLGDDCEYLQAAGGIVTGFDISSTAIAWCKRRFPDSRVQYVVKNLFDAPQEWEQKYNFVLESYTLQVLPPDLRLPAIEVISRFVATGGSLLVITRGRSESMSAGEMPWPLTKRELHTFCNYGLTMVECDDYSDDESPPVRRFRALFEKA